LNQDGNVNFQVTYFYQQTSLSVFPEQDSGQNIEDFIASSVGGYLMKFNELKFNLAPADD